MHHDHPIDALPDISPTKSKKRQAAKSVSGRAYSIGAVWEFRDEGDLEYQGQQDKFQPKRRKSAPAKRTKSAKSPHQLLPQIPEPVEGSLTVPQNNDQDQEASQLTTPPDSAKRLKNKPGPKSKKPQLPHFKSLTVTKPVTNQEKNFEDEPVPSHKIKSQLGWTTTQDAVKLTKTTLDKLASFKFKAPIEAQSAPAATRYAITHTSVGTQQLEDKDEGVAPPSSDYCQLPSSDSLFQEACWNVETSDPFSNEPATAASQIIDCPVGQIQEMTTNSPPQRMEYPPGVTSRAGDSTILHADNVLGDVEDHRPPIKRTPSPRDASHYDGPTSSEARMLDGLLDDLQFLQTEQQLTNDESRENTLRPDGKSVEDPTVRHTLSDTVALEVDGTGTNTEKERQGMLEDPDPSIRPQVARKYQRRHSEMQIDQSKDEEIEIISHGASQDFELDEYDEGLNDADLFEIGSDHFVPETQSPRRLTPQENVEPIEGFSGPAQAAHQAGNNHPKRWTPKAIQANPGIVNSQTSPLLNSAKDDDFPMDYADEEMMLEAADQIMGIVETFEPPESLQHDFQDSVDGEFFDRSLQFSPPKPQTSSASSSKVRNSPSTDKSSNPLSPRLEPLASEEEDWSFIRRENADADVPPEVEEDYRCFVVPPVPPVAKISDYFKPQATQQTTKSTSKFLDDSHEYQPLKAFVRPDFPSLTPDRCQIVGVSTQSFLRVCFRIGEMFKEGGRRNALGQDAVIELFAKVIFSTRQAGTSKQTFQFGDLFFEKGPIASGVLMNYKTTGLAESESKVFIGKPGMMARCLGRLKRDKQTASGWLLHVITVRETDWEEIRWTKRIVSAGLVKSEVMGR